VRLAADPRPLPTEYYQCRHCDAVWRLTAPRHHPPGPDATFEHTAPGMLTEMLRAGGASGVPIVREPISMFAESVTLPSPDGRFTATMTGAQAFQAGSPSHGTLQISTGIVREHCSPSMVWSDDSEYLATCEIVDRVHPARVVVFSMRRAEARYAPGQYDGLELQSFSDGTVRGTDGEKAVEIDVSALEWDAPRPEPPRVEGPAPSVASRTPAPVEAVEPVAAPVAARAEPLAAAMPRGWAVVNGELRIAAWPPSSFDGALTAIAVLGITLLFWVFVFIANRAGVAQSPVLLGALAVASLLVLGWLALVRRPWRVVFDRTAGSVRATRGRRTAGPARFTPGLVALRTVRARPRAFVTLRIGTVDLILASQPAADAAALREALAAWMTE
jgi:hypothetical protein